MRRRGTMGLFENSALAKSISDGSWRPNIYLTNICIAQFQRDDDFVATKLFPIVPVSLPMSKFYRFGKADLARANMSEKPAFGSVQPAVFSQTEDSYSTRVYQALYGIDQISSMSYGRSNAPGVSDPKVAKARVAAEQTKLFMDLMFAEKYFRPGAWANEWTGTASSPLSSSQFYQFDNSNSDPIKLIDDLKVDLKREGRRKPNRLALGANTYKALKNNPSVIERVKFGGSTSNPATVTTNVLAQLFEVEQVLVMESTYNRASYGDAADMEYVCDPNGLLLCYSTDSPAIDEPSAGYTFAWDMLGNGQHMALTSFQGPLETHSEFVEALCAFDMKQVCTDLAVYLKDCVSS